MKKLDLITACLLVLGGLNWGLVGLFQFDLVTTVLGTGTLTQVFYACVGCSALYEAYSFFAKPKEAETPTR